MMGNGYSLPIINQQIFLYRRKMKILIMGAGKMGSFFIDLLSFDHEVGVFEKDPRRLRFTYNCQRFTTLDEVKAFAPQLVINAVTVKYTIPAFEETKATRPS